MAVFFDERTGIFYLEGKEVTYAFLVNDCGYLEHLYFGERIGRDDIRYIAAAGRESFEACAPSKCAYNLKSPEIAFFGTGDYKEPTVLVQNAAGDRISELLFDGYEILAEKPPMIGMPSLSGGETLLIHLRDALTGFAADLYYTVYDDASVIARRVVYKNGGASAVTLWRAYSFAFGLPAGAYERLSLYGGWATERHVERVPLPHGVSSIDSKRATSSATLNPFMAVLEVGASEEAGTVYGFSLVYSSSYVLKAEVTSSGNVQVTGGINDFDFSWRLEPHETFETPETVIAYSGRGIGGMSREFHDAFRRHLINRRFVNRERPIVINNWEATYFQFDTEKLMRLVDAAADTGIDTFVLDDGWFGKRNDDRSGLGDWFVNTEKMQGGLGPIIDYVHAKGMKFGLWFEPEMVSEDSELYRRHPDYAIRVPQREACVCRNQFVLDLTRTDVRDHIVASVNRILDENQIEYVKWDYNRNVTEFYSLGREPGRQQEFAHRYALGLYDLCERIVEAHPHIFFEGCSGGGARFDPAMLHYFPQIWTSDDTDAEERTQIQYGTSLVYPLSAMSCHVSVCPNHQTGRTASLQTRTDIAHLGATGYELDLTRMDAGQRETVKASIAEYKKWADLILEGDLYRMDDPQTTNYFSVTVVAKDQSSAALVTYRRMGRPNAEVKRVKFRGLDRQKTYFLEEHGKSFSGATLMNVGIPIAYPSGDFGTCKLHVTAIDG